MDHVLPLHALDPRDTNFARAVTNPDAQFSSCVRWEQYQHEQTNPRTAWWLLPHATQ